MESKAQKAKRAIIEREIQYLIKCGERGGNCELDSGKYYFDLAKIFNEVDAINRLIKEYGSDDEFSSNLHNSIEKIYDSLMEQKAFEKALELAKKYGL